MEISTYSFNIIVFDSLFGQCKSKNDLDASAGLIAISAADEILVDSSAEYDFEDLHSVVIHHLQETGIMIILTDTRRFYNRQDHLQSAPLHEDRYLLPEGDQTHLVLRRRPS